MADNMTPTERAAKMRAMPTHVVYMTRGGGTALITQSFCTVVSQSADSVTIQGVMGVKTIARSDVFAIKDGRLTNAEMDAVFAEHGAKQRRG